MTKKSEAKKGRRIKAFFIAAAIIIVLNVLFNMGRILFFDRLSNTEVYHYPDDISIIYDGEERELSGAYYVNSYLYYLLVHRIDESKAEDVMANPKAVLVLEGYNFYLSNDDEIVFPLHTRYIRQRSILDRIFMMIFYDDTNYLYYSTKSDAEHFENLTTWFRMSRQEEHDWETNTDTVEVKNEILENFTALTNKNIDKVEARITSDMQEIQADWLKGELINSELAKQPDAIVALAFEVVIYYDDGTTAVLRLLDPYLGRCSIRYDDISYCFENKKIAEWMDEESG